MQTLKKKCKQSFSIFKRLINIFKDSANITWENWYICPEEVLPLYTTMMDFKSVDQDVIIWLSAWTQE